MLTEFNMHQSKSTDTPEQHGVILTDDDSIDMNAIVEPSMRRENDQRKQRYQSAVGYLLYIALSTRPDICHAVNQLSRFLHSPGEAHWNAVKRVMRYLRGTTQIGLEYRCDEMNRNQNINQSQQRSASTTTIPNEIDLKTYVDADWGGITDTR